MTAVLPITSPLAGTTTLAAPAKIKSLIGKQYITPKKAQIAIDLLLGEKLIAKSATSVKKELQSIGVIAEIDKAW